MSETNPAGERLPDVLAPGLKVVFCGSAAGTVSARLGAYYAGPGNRFWPTLYRVGLTPRLLAPQDFRDLPRYGLGLTDMAKRYAGADAGIRRGHDDPQALRAKILRIRPRVLAFVGKRPARALLGRSPAYGRQPEMLGDAEIWVLPSPSGAARRWWDEAPWQALAKRVR
ncbi:MAG TPA: mismatch-specific DNA-glycosylase [Alphaproteobacteria bacterium]|nr:mismatch-specific DNA-glycosylase [Alphaproteobacteria bacterium]